MTIVVHHNPDCETSRNVLAIIPTWKRDRSGRSRRHCRPGETVLDLLERLPAGPI